MIIAVQIAVLLFLLKLVKIKAIFNHKTMI